MESALAGKVPARQARKPSATTFARIEIEPIGISAPLVVAGNAVAASLAQQRRSSNSCGSPFPGYLTSLVTRKVEKLTGVVVPHADRDSHGALSPIVAIRVHAAR